MGRDYEIDRHEGSLRAMNAEREGDVAVEHSHDHRWSLARMPPPGDPAVASYVGKLYEDARDEVHRLGMHERWMANYVLSRAKTTVVSRFKDILMGGYNSALSLGIIGANIERTVANITARNPVASVVATSGDQDASDTVTAMVDQWNNEECQRETLAVSVKIMETYGTAIEKAVLDSETGKMVPCPLDVTAFLPAPGKYHDIQKMPYCCHHYAQDISQIEARFPHLTDSVEELANYDQLFLTDREDRLIDSNMQGVGGDGQLGSGGYDMHRYTRDARTVSSKEQKGLVVEVWCRDYSTRVVETMQTVVDEATGQTAQAPVKEEQAVFPGGIRLIVLVQGYDKNSSGYVVAYDGPNPNVNHGIPVEHLKDCYLFRKYPFAVSRSYLDTEMFWGFSQAETTGDIAQAVDELWRIIVRYLKLCLLPPIIIPKDTGLDKSQFAYVERLVLQPVSTNTANGIRFLDMPTPPSWLFQALDVLMRFFDRTSQIEDVERGDAPAGIVAASAIQMLQERAAALVRAKIQAVDTLVRTRGRCFISMVQNFHVTPEMINVHGAPVEIAGIQLINEKFSYIVESGSTVIKTEAEERQLAMELFTAGAIDQRALLEAVKFRGWREVVERMAEAGPLEQAMQILIEAGLPEELVQQLYQIAMEHQGGPGDSAVARGGVNAQTAQTAPGFQGMRGMTAQAQRGGAPAKPGVPMVNQEG